MEPVKCKSVVCHEETRRDVSCFEQFNKMRWAYVRCVTFEFKFSVRRREGNGPLGILWRRWEYNIKTGLREMEWGRGVHCIDLKDRNK